MHSLPRHFFVTGTDTGVGKTTVTVRLMQQLIAQGLTVIGMKPIASGCAWVDGRWQNDDVLQLTAASNVSAPPELINPYCFEPAIAPHIAAAQAGVTIDFHVIQAAYAQLASMADVVIVEGAGGLLVPLNGSQTIADLIQALQLPALLVVGMRLGCINHALLTAQVLKQRNIDCCGWVANNIDPQMSVPQENLQSLITGLQQPPVLQVPFQASLS
ncbi:dethiobiotin synthase [Methylophilus sp.]|jgi:dethiobiotin synthetase|uniref:dethiobiotin synthase n=1 Tax=Methylophilus sp. TaxID=29541 RepID=UPI0011D9220B|nr:dethiobiotin synthase [Methylophilus sp.]TXI45299.1 MAG: dethiobiotin synthase [Methylophilus sp.]